jgi:methionyl-tRNA formyltransferase
MKVILVTAADYMSVRAAIKLKDAGMLSCIVIPEKYKERFLPFFSQAGFDSTHIHTISRGNLEQRLLSLVQQYEADSIFVITCSWKIPASVLSATKHGCINFHPGLIPDYKGADPIFWQLRNREKNGGFTVHYMTDEIDEGPVLLMQKMPLIPGETYGIHHLRLSELAAEIVLKAADMVANNEPGKKMAAVKAPQYFKRPGKQDLTIDWQKHTAEEIEALVSATNPKYNGAFTSIRNMEMAILEVAFADLNNGNAKVVPGTIVYADAVYGLIVACNGGKFLKVCTICMPEGYLSGCKLFSMGFRVGEQFQ